MKGSLVRLIDLLQAEGLLEAAKTRPTAGKNAASDGLGEKGPTTSTGYCVASGAISEGYSAEDLAVTPARLCRRSSNGQPGA